MKHLKRLWCWPVTHVVFKRGWDSWGHRPFQSYTFYQCWERHFQPPLDYLIIAACLLLSFPGAKLNATLTSKNFQSGAIMLKVQINLTSSLPTYEDNISLRLYIHQSVEDSHVYIVCLFWEYVCCCSYEQIAFSKNMFAVSCILRITESFGLEKNPYDQVQPLTLHHQVNY